MDTGGAFGSFSRFSEKGKTALVRHVGRLTLAAALLDGEGCKPAGEGGRGGLLRFPYETGWGVIRGYRRGGFVRRFLKESYFVVNRPLREFLLHVRLFEQGLPMPEPLGVLWERRGLCFRGALATREIDGVTLFEYLASAPDAPGETLGCAGALIREMHDAGVFHADLQVRNILVGRDHLYLIDFDRARLACRVSRLQRARNLLRLRRSLVKNFLPLRFFPPLLKGYGTHALPYWLDRVYAAKGWLSDLVSGRGT